MKIYPLWILAVALKFLFYCADAEQDGQPHQFKPEPNVTKENWIFPPFNRWGYKNAHSFQSVDVISKGSPEDFVKLPHSSVDYNVQGITYIARDERLADHTKVKRTFAEMLNRTYTDGIVILWKGKLVYEEYFDGLTADMRHVLFSATKSYCGLMAAMLAHEGLIDPSKLVTEYLPAMRNTGLSGATVRQVMDMSVDYDYSEEYKDMSSGVMRLAVAAGMLQLPPELQYSGPTNIRAFLTGLQKVAEPHGEKFTYRSSDTVLLGWIIDTILGTNAASTKYFQKKLWSKLGQGSDAFMFVDSTHFPAWYGGSMATVRDAARFGEMMRLGGVNDAGEQVVPKEVVDDILAGGSDLNVEQFSKSEDGAPGEPMEGWAYRNQYWVKPNHVFSQVGVNGQWVWVDTKADLTIAKFSSFPTMNSWIIDEDTIQAFMALGAHFEKVGSRKRRNKQH